LSQLGQKTSTAIYCRINSVTETTVTNEAFHHVQFKLSEQTSLSVSRARDKQSAITGADAGRGDRRPQKETMKVTFLP